MGLGLYVNEILKARHHSRDSVHLYDQLPSSTDVMSVPISDILPSENDEAMLKGEMKVMLKKIIVENLPTFSDLNDDIIKNIPHNYTKESSMKSQMVPLGVIDKDETKIGDSIEIMESYQANVPLKPLKLPLHADEQRNDAQNARINSTTKWLQLQGFTFNIQEWHKRCLLLQDVYDELYMREIDRFD